MSRLQRGHVRSRNSTGKERKSTLSQTDFGRESPCASEAQLDSSEVDVEPADPDLAAGVSIVRIAFHIALGVASRACTK